LPVVHEIDAQDPARAISRRRTLAAAATRILPSDGGPGAREAGAAEAVAMALEHPFLRLLRPFFESHLDGLAGRARELYGRDLADCDPEQQDALLREVAADPQPRSRMFFELLVSLTIEGFLGDPVHGGNRGEVGWRAIGLAPGGPRANACVVAPGAAAGEAS
jgi:gluconate 2-dehydrogenase gamma chain